MHPDAVRHHPCSERIVRICDRPGQLQPAAALGKRFTVSAGKNRQKLTGHLLLTELAVLARQPQLPLQGVVEFDALDFRLNRDGQPLSASGTINVMDLRLTLGQPLILGDFTAQMSSADPEGIQGVLKDNNGPLMLEGIFSLQPDGRYRFNGQTAVRDTENRALRQAMNLLGPPGKDGRWTLSFSGVLSR